MGYGESEPTWGAGPSPGAGNYGHADYQQQAAQHFGGGLSSPSPVGYPQQTPQTVGYGVPSPLPPRESFVQRLMESGVRGELIRQPWFQNLRSRSADPFVISVYVGGIVLSIILGLIPGMLVPTVLQTALWAAIGYVFFAVGTKVAHQFILFGICLVGALMMVGSVLSTLSIMSVGRGIFGYWGAYLEPVAFLVLSLLWCAAVAAFLIYVGLQVHRGIQRLSAPPAP